MRERFVPRYKARRWARESMDAQRKQLDAEFEATLAALFDRRLVIEALTKLRDAKPPAVFIH